MIDGNIDKEVWKGIKEMQLVKSANGEEPMQKTSAKMLWSDNYLYVSFNSEDTYINATMTEYNDKLYDEEVVEIFLDDDCDLKTYIEIEVNPLNALLHYEIHNNLEKRILTFARTEKVIESAVCRDDDKGFWNVEIKIPFSEFFTAHSNPPKSGDKWRMNLYRIDRPKDGNDEYTCWSPTGKGTFHQPQNFGELIFTV